jgi:hypothetical protein
MGMGGEQLPRASKYQKESEAVSLLENPRAGHRNCPTYLLRRLSKPTDMTIHWIALEEHFLMVPLVWQFNHFRGTNAFSEFFSKNLRT